MIQYLNGNFFMYAFFFVHVCVAVCDHPVPFPLHMIWQVGLPVWV